MASATGTARIPTQGSWRPLVTTSVGSPALVIDLRALKIDEVGLTANLATISCPVDMPPRIPPAWLEEYFGFHFSKLHLAMRGLLNKGHHYQV